MNEILARIFMGGIALCCLGVVALATWVFITESIL